MLLENNRGVRAEMPIRNLRIALTSRKMRAGREVRAVAEAGMGAGVAQVEADVEAGRAGTKADIAGI